MHSQIAAIGDLHGELSALERILDHLNTNGFFQVFDPDRNTYELNRGNQLVFTGDYIDRGPQGLQVLDKVMSLADNGCAIAIPGNHELLALAFREEASRIVNDPRLSQRAYSNYSCNVHGCNGGMELISEFNPGDFGDALKKFADTFSRTEKYGAWIRDLAPFWVEEIDGREVAFVHAGIPTNIGDEEALKYYSDWYSSHMEKTTEDARAKYLYSSLVGEGSIFWVREDFYAKSQEALESHLKRLGLDAIVIGHTRSKEGLIRSFHDLVFDIDIGMSRAYGGNTPGYLIVDAEGVHAQYVCDTSKKTLRKWGPVNIALRYVEPTGNPEMTASVQDTHHAGEKVTLSPYCQCCGDTLKPFQGALRCYNCDITQGY